MLCIRTLTARSRSPCGERGLKSSGSRQSRFSAPCRSPCGERGLKYCSPDNKGQRSASLPVLGAWIEMYLWQEMTAGNRSLPVRGAWIEMPTVTRQPPHMPVSLPVRGAWIEIGTNPPHTTIWRCRSPCGERGLKSHPTKPGEGRHPCRSPCGERGLKCPPRGESGCCAVVAPRAGSVD